jgi:hypothetical protein
MEKEANYMRRRNMKTFGREICTGLVVLFLILGIAQLAVAQPQIYYGPVSFEPLSVYNTGIAVGDNVKIKCGWEFYNSKITHLVWPAGEGQFIINGLGFKKTPGIVPAGDYAPSSKKYGHFEATWQPEAPGEYTISCEVTTQDFSEKTYAIPVKNLVKKVTVKPKPIKLEQDTSPKVGMPGSPIIAATIKPNLSVTDVQVKIEPNCQAPQPAMTAIVTIKNTGGALPANKGTIFVKEQGGTNLGSAGIQIPAIGAGQTQTVNIPAITSQPYSSLAGAHQVQVILNPQSEGGQLSFNKPADPYVFSATFPSGYCKPTQRQQPGQQQRR